MSTTVSRGQRMAGRAVLVVLHRYLGLMTAGFLLIAGLTGSLLAWNAELDVLINPKLFHVAAPGPEVPVLDALALRRAVVERYPGAEVVSVPLTVDGRHPVAFFLQAGRDPVTGEIPPLANDQIFIDLYTAAVVGERKWGDIRQGMINFMPFVYRLHYSLAQEPMGKSIFGVIALLWAVNGFVGLYLTFPSVPRGLSLCCSVDRKLWFSRWQAAWKLRVRGGFYQLNFDLHRAGGLWFWAMLLVVAWSAVRFNLPRVYDPVMNAVFAHQDIPSPQAVAPPQSNAVIGWEQARAVGRGQTEPVRSCRKEPSPNPTLRAGRPWHGRWSRAYQISIVRQGLGVIGGAARQQLSFVDYLEEICSNVDTLEAYVYKAIEKNLWLSGVEYSLFASNITLKWQIEDFLGKI